MRFVMINPADKADVADQLSPEARQLRLAIDASIDDTSGEGVRREKAHMVAEPMPWLPDDASCRFAQNLCLHRVSFFFGHDTK